MLRYYDTDLNEIYNDKEDIAKSQSQLNVIVYRTLVIIMFITCIYYYAIHLLYNL